MKSCQKVMDKEKQEMLIRRLSLLYGKLESNKRRLRFYRKFQAFPSIKPFVKFFYCLLIIKSLKNQAVKN